MKISSLCAFLAFSIFPASAQVPITNVAPLPATLKAPQMATVTPFIAGLKEAQGMALDFENNLLVCDYGAGEVLKFSRDGKALEKFATGLKGPSTVVPFNRVVLISERKANRIFSVWPNREDNCFLPAIEEPIGLVAGGNAAITAKKGGERPQFYAVSHTTSKVFRFTDEPGGSWQVIYAAPEEGDKRYGYRCLAFDGSVLYLTDEVEGKVLMVSPAGRSSTFATGISDPSGIAIGPDKMVYVTNEGDGGQLLRLNSEGGKTVIAEKLGRPRGILFLDAKTVLVSNRDGNVWKVALP